MVRRPVIDFHCHIDLYSDPGRVVEECQQRGIYVLSVTTTPSAWSGTNELAKNRSRIQTALGLHPQLAHERHAEIELFDKLLPETRYVGEIGLDGGPEYRAHWKIQTRVFEHVLNSCKKVGGRILSIHSRHASGAVLDLLEKYPESGTPVLHWYSGNQRDLDRAVRMGCWFSVGPAMLRGERGRSNTLRMPRERILTESDGPFAQIDGCPVFPWQVDEAIETLGKIWDMPGDEVAKTLNKNLRQLVTTHA